jgi:hypothetical protein
LPHIRIIPALEEKEWALEGAQKPLGRLLLLAVFLGLMSIQVPWHIVRDTGVVLLATTFFPARRRTIIMLAALYWASTYVYFPLQLMEGLEKRIGIESAPLGPNPMVTVVALSLVLSALAFRYVVARPKSLLARYPAYVLAGGYALLLALLATFDVQLSAWLWLWALALVFGRYLWFLCYALIDARKTSAEGFTPQLGLFQPFWGSTATPFLKGEGYVRKIEAKDDAQLAKAQLKGLKLMAWSCVLFGVAELAKVTLLAGESSNPWPQELRFASIESAMRASMAHTPLPWWRNWVAMFIDLGMKGLTLSIWGHRFVAVGRMAGFAARRNTYKPFLATNVSAFFNRYYYYFKELLVDCFFYPVFLHAFKKNFTLRLFVATFMAAGFGNFLYHYLRDVQVIIAVGPLQALVASQVHMVYCGLLAVGIFFSQQRRMKKKREPTSVFAQVRAIAGVWLTFAVLNSLLALDRRSSLAQHIEFLIDSLPLPG